MSTAGALVNLVCENPGMTTGELLELAKEMGIVEGSSQRQISAPLNRSKKVYSKKRTDGQTVWYPVEGKSLAAVAPTRVDIGKVTIAKGVTDIVVATLPDAAHERAYPLFLPGEQITMRLVGFMKYEVEGVKVQQALASSLTIFVGDLPAGMEEKNVPYSLVSGPVTFIFESHQAMQIILAGEKESISDYQFHIPAGVSAYMVARKVKSAPSAQVEIKYPGLLLPRVYGIAISYNRDMRPNTRLHFIEPSILQIKQTLENPTNRPFNFVGIIVNAEDLEDISPEWAKELKMEKGGSDAKYAYLVFPFYKGEMLYLDTLNLD